MIQVEELTRYYGDFAAVEGVSFEIDRGEIVGLLGHNGAGKTTIMKMITGYLEPSSGRVQIDGLDIETQREAVQKQIGYLPENCPIYPEMTVVDYLDYTASLHGVPEGERMDRVCDAIARTELGPKATAAIQTLSRGYCQRVGVAQAILHRPGILILDEPTNGLDPTQIHHMRNLVRSLAEKATVILSTHILQEVQAICDRVLIIRRGRKVLDERLDALQQGRRLLLSTGAGPERARTVLGSLDIVQKVEEDGSEAGHFDYALTLAPDADGAQAAALVARAAVENGFELYSLRPERQDLEAIFGRIASGEGAKAHG